MIGQIIKEIRTEKGLSMLDMQAICGVHRNTLSRIESGRYDAGVRTVEKVLDALGYELEVVLK